MISASKNLSLILLHVLLGILIEYRFLSVSFGLIVLIIGFLDTIISENGSNQAVKWAIYLVALEIVLRMTKGNLFHEYGKYSVALLMITGLIVEKNKRPLNVVYLLCFCFLLFGIVNVPFTESFEIRRQISFNLSGPALLCLSSIYFYNRKMDLNELLTLLKMSLWPMVSLMTYLFFYTPSFESIDFTSSASFAASGGYGPNQVATAIGFAIFVIALMLIEKKSFSGILIIDLFFISYLFYRGVATLSRGGLLTGLLCLIIVILFYLFSGRLNAFKFFRNSLFIAFFGFLSFWILLNQIGDVLIYRYTGKDSIGREKEDISSGRLDFISLELEAFVDNPITGLGVGGSKNYREDTDFEGATHNELTRVLVEHGFFGVVVLMVFLFYPLAHIYYQNMNSIGILLSFLAFWFLTINHSAMRMAFPGFIYGLSLMNLNFNEENSISGK